MQSNFVRVVIFITVLSTISRHVSPDLSTLASVVTTLASMDKDQDATNGDLNDSAARAFDVLAKAANPKQNKVSRM